MLAERKVDTDRLLYALGSSGELAGLTIAQVKNRIARELSPEPEPEPRRLTFLSRFEAFVAVRSEGTQRVYILLQGINIVDLCRLSSVVDGRAEYKRAKTGRLYSVALLPEALAIIERHKGEGQLLNYLDTCRDYRSFYNRLTYALRSMGERSGVKGLSTYWARHTWATFASSLDVPKETIAAALGHGGWSVTDIYIDFDQRKADEANQRVAGLARELGL